MKIVNLRQARKRQAKANKSKQADANRISHGLSKEARAIAKTHREKQSKALDGHKIDKS